MFDLSTLLPIRSAATLTGPTSGFFEYTGARRTTSGETVSPTRALMLSSYFACLRVLSEDTAKLPIEVYRRLDPVGKQHLPAHSLARLLSTPNPEMTGFTFVETLTQWAAGWGNGLAEIVRDGAGVPVELWPIHPSRVQLLRVKGRLIYRVMTDPDPAAIRVLPQSVDFPASDMFHIRGMGSSTWGYSIAQYGAESIGLSLAAESFGAAFFGNGSVASGILTHPQSLSEPARVNLRESWQKVYGGARNSNKMAILEEGMVYTQLSIPPEQAQFLETRQFQVEEICRWARVAPHKIQHLLHATFSNIEHQGREHLTDTLLPWLVRWTSEIKRQLITEPDVFVAQNVNVLLMGDTNARANFYRTMVNIGVYSPDEVREMEDENPVGGASAEHYMQSNMSTLDRIADGTATATAKTGPPAQKVEVAPADDGAAEAAERRTQLDAQVAALRPAFVAEADRVLRKEALATQRAAGKPGAVQWAGQFFDEHAGYLASALEPLAGALSGIAANVLGVPVKAIDVRGFAEDDARAARASFLAAGTPPASHTPSALADAAIALVLAAYPESGHVHP